MADWKAGPERLSLTDGSLFGGHAETVQRLELALPYCAGRRVLDAGCGTGYGTWYLARHGAASALGIDISTEAIDEASRHFSSPGVSFAVGDIQLLRTRLGNDSRFGAIVSFETIAHLQDPDKFLDATFKLLEDDGALVISTPNRESFPGDGTQIPPYDFYFRPYAPGEFEALLRNHFPNVRIMGQWLSHAGKLRKARDFANFQYLSESYFQPGARLTRTIKRLLGKRTLPPPQYHGDADAFPGDYLIAPANDPPVSWAPTILVATCQKA